MTRTILVAACAALVAPMASAGGFPPDTFVAMRLTSSDFIAESPAPQATQAQVSTKSQENTALEQALRAAEEDDDHVRAAYLRARLGR